ncbi:MAG: hypothetical protein KatS3mg027_2180 [Bacteroidia bacterium]|nr:MAG: hypothetical protein KatS3mg027_2180 [Bacteroidia bacterium]
MNDSINTLQQQHQKILELIKEKSVLKQDVFFNTIHTFNNFRTYSKEIINNLKEEVSKIDKRIGIQYTEVNQFAYQIKVAGDILEFFMHTNVFEIEKSSPLYKSPYIKQNPLNAYCGIIYVYNFMADSFKYNRPNDIGILTARIFINKDNHFFIETKLPMASKFSNFSLEPINEYTIKEIINELIIHSIQFDLTTPPFDALKEISVSEINERTSWITLRTGKRLGFFTDSGKDDDDFSFQL